MADRRLLETGTEDLLGYVEDRIAILTMNRPSRRNALSSEMLAALQAALAELEVATDVGCVVLTGAEGAFCSGGDVKAMNEANSGSGKGERPPMRTPPRAWCPRCPTEAAGRAQANFTR